MKSIFLDTETTGLRPGQIAQLTYLIEENKKLVGVKNYFFTVDEMDEQAEKVHGFSMERLQMLSQGFIFADLVPEIYEDFEGATIIAHNVNFDKKFIDAEFGRLDSDCGAAKSFCTMAYFKDILKIPARNGQGYKNPRLEEVVDFYNIDKQRILEVTKKLFECDDVSFHDARYDTTAMYLCCLKSRNRKDFEEILKNPQVSLFD
jgi:DNA polymerase III epsilon subunit-like protein